jgi:hypothetical protein
VFRAQSSTSAHSQAGRPIALTRGTAARQATATCSYGSVPAWALFATLTQALPPGQPPLLAPGACARVAGSERVGEHAAAMPSRALARLASPVRVQVQRREEAGAQKQQRPPSPHIAPTNSNAIAPTQIIMPPCGSVGVARR